jgi:hypothetical protein
LLAYFTEIITAFRDHIRKEIRKEEERKEGNKERKNNKGIE